jgi:hypothetical protein
MDGLITDDNGQVLRVEGLDVIGADLEQLVRHAGRARSVRRLALGKTLFS